MKKISAENNNIRYTGKIAYNGSKFRGWAVQPNDIISVQGKLQNHLSQLFQEPIKVIGSGRTDAGVHALGQIFHFDTSKKILVNQIKKYLNNAGCGNWNIFYIRQTNSNFHARYLAKEKIYLYKINVSPNLSPLDYDYVWQYLKPLDLNKLRKVAKIFVGTHDFLSFATVPEGNTVRTIKYIKINKNNNIVSFKIAGNGFLRSMVRMVVGAIVNCANEKISIADCIDFFNNPKKGKAVFKAPAGGLYLMGVKYKHVKK